MSPVKQPAPPRAWLDAQGQPLSCTEKVKVLEENWTEVREALQNALDDAILMGCTSAFAKGEFARLVRELESPYREDTKKGAS